jgi:hypothetical protein
MKLKKKLSCSHLFMKNAFLICTTNEKERERERERETCKKDLLLSNIEGRDLMKKKSIIIRLSNFIML